MRICFLLKVRLEMVPQYEARHVWVWPEMLDALRETGQRSSSILLKRDGPLVGYLEAEDFEKYFAEMETHSVNARFIGPTRSDPTLPDYRSSSSYAWFSEDQRCETFTLRPAASFQYFQEAHRGS